ncbi:MAG TPA: molybdopterin cofactor-binding domain-containing protein [Streptosporangiaceae bacterium]
MTKHQHSPQDPDVPSGGFGRRRFLGYLLAAPTLAVGVQLAPDLARTQAARASIITPPEPEEILDLGDAQDLAAAATSGLITVVVNADGTASFAAIRTEVGQGMTTAIAMMIAEYMDLDVDQVSVTLADARPELIFNQLTGGSNSMRSQYGPTCAAAALARQQLVQAAAGRWEIGPARLRTERGEVIHPDGRRLGYGELAAEAASSRTRRVAVPKLKASSKFRILGHAHNRIDALDIVTGKKRFGMDLQVPGALPTMMVRPPTVGGTVRSVNNTKAILAMPGITDVAVVSTGVAIRGRTFGECISAIQIADVTWGPGPVDGQSDATVLAALKAAAPPLAAVPDGALSVSGEFTFYFASNTPLEPDCAIADVRADSAEIWSCLKVPIDALQDIALQLGLPQSAVTVHVTEGGGSFGRHLFHDCATEAAAVSKVMGKPVKLQWSRTDTFRQGRTHPMCVSQVQATTLLGNVVTYTQLHTSVQTSFSHGLGEILTATAASLPVGNLGFSETIFELTQSSPYNFGVTAQLLNEIQLEFSTGSMRNIYSPNVVTAEELIVDQIAARFGQDPVAFRRAFLKDDRVLAVLNKAATVGNWGRAMPAHTAQGIAVHSEYQAAVAVLAEIDCSPAVVNRTIPDGVGGPRVTKMVIVVDPGFAINPRGLEAQMIGGAEDGVGLALTASLHLKDGLFLEGSWDNFFYTREWNTPPAIEVVIMPSTSNSPSGAGELAVAPSMAAVACAYARATGTMPTSFPINHGTLGFTPYPAEPSTPQSPTNGLKYTF